jgi:hypothetical protein
MLLKRLLCAAALAVGVVGVSGAASAATVLLQPDSVWNIQDAALGPDSFFQDDYQAASNEVVKITDLFVVGDSFGIYVNGVFIRNTPSVADWTSYGTDPHDPPYTIDADTAFASGLFSATKLHLHAGDILSLTDISLPATFTDGTVAVEAVPEPAAWAMLLLGLAGLGAALRWRGRAFAAV